MSRRTATTLVMVFLGVVIGLLWYRPDHQESPTASPPAKAPAVGASPNQTLMPAEKTSAPQPLVAPSDQPPEISSLIANNLNARGSSIQQDLRILEDVLDAWRSNYPHDGNPVGENAEITAALSGGNSFHLALIARNNPAINADGELCDRWGTPFRFHQLSGERMEIRSAGPDRKFATPDDAVITP